MATLTVYGNTADGTIDSSDATYATARGGGAVNVNYADTTYGLQIGQTTGYDLLQSAIAFTNSLISADTITAAVVSLWCTYVNAAQAFTLNLRGKNWGAALTTADWVADASGSTLLASLASSGFSSGSYNGFTSEAGFNGGTGITKGGTDYWWLSSSRQEAGSAPASDNERVDFSAADTAGTTNDPKLVITYTPGNTAPTITAGPTTTYATLTRAGPSNTWGLTFTAHDPEQTGAGAITYYVYTGASRTGSQIATGTCTSDSSKVITGLAYNIAGLAEGSNTLYLSVYDGTAYSADSSFVLLRDDTAPTAATSISTTPSPVV